MSTHSLLRVALVVPVLVVPGLLLVSGCGGGGGTGPTSNTPVPTPNPTTKATGTPTPTTNTNANIAQGQTAFTQAVDAYTASQNPQSANAALQSAIASFQAAVNASPNSSDANAGLAASLLAQLASDPNSPLAKYTNQSFLKGSKSLGLDNIVALKGQKATAQAPLTAIKSAVSHLKTKSSKLTTSDGTTIDVAGLQSYIDTVDLPRLQQIAASLGKVSTDPTYNFAIYSKGTTVKKLYGPDFGAAQAFVQGGIAILATLDAYNLDPGSIYVNVAHLSDLDADHNGQLTPNEYLGTGSFATLRSNGAANLSLAYSSLSGLTNTASTFVQAESNFSPPSDALVQLSSEQRQSLTNALPVITQVKTALSGQASYPINGGTLTLDASKFFNTPVSDLRTAMPTIIYSTDSSGSEYVTDISFASTQNTTFNGLFPNGTQGVVELLLGPSNGGGGMLSGPLRKATK